MCSVLCKCECTSAFVRRNLWQQLGQQFARELSFHNAILETDGKGVADRLNSQGEFFEADGNLLLEIKELSTWFHSFACIWQCRTTNMVAHELVQFALNSVGFVSWYWLTPLLSDVREVYFQWSSVFINKNKYMKNKK